jgi:hypothetical protein
LSPLLSLINGFFVPFGEDGDRSFGILEILSEGDDPRLELVLKRFFLSF